MMPALTEFLSVEFDSRKALQPFLDSNALEKILKKQALKTTEELQS